MLRVFDKIQTVTPAAIVENKRLGAALAMVKEDVVQKVLVPGYNYTENRQSCANKGIPRFDCYPVLNHARFSTIRPLIRSLAR